MLLMIMKSLQQQRMMRTATNRGVLMELQEVVVLIDDDKLFHHSWQMKAAKMNINLRCFTSVDNFILASSEVTKKSAIYVDSNLEDGVIGENEAKRLHDLGYENIWLCTGYTDIEISNFPWIKGITSKKPPF